MARVARIKEVRWEPSDGREPATFRLRPLRLDERILSSEVMSPTGPPAASITAEQARHIRDVCAAHIEGWVGIDDEAGAPIPCSPETAAAVLDAEPEAALAVWTALMGQGGDASRPKGSGSGYGSGSPTGTQTAVSESETTDGDTDAITSPS